MTDFHGVPADAVCMHCGAALVLVSSQSEAVWFGENLSGRCGRIVEQDASSPLHEPTALPDLTDLDQVDQWLRQ